MKKPPYPILAALRCCFVLTDTMYDGTERPRLCFRESDDHLHKPAETCTNAPERHHAYQPPKRHRHVRPANPFQAPPSPERSTE